MDLQNDMSTGPLLLLHHAMNLQRNKNLLALLRSSGSVVAHQNKEASEIEIASLC
jgi:hypothetical protein